MSRDDYFIGLDVGSNSVGWAVTDVDFNLCRIKGKTAWGSRMFSEASSAKERRTFRATGRRLARRRHRVLYLQEIFAREISKIDPYFFLRLNESYLWDEDKSNNAKAAMPLFNDKDLEMKFHKTFPTIYHLRFALANEKDPSHDFALSDLRFVYLALHHIVKYRGNFLSNNSIESNVAITDETIQRLNITFREIAERLDEDDEENKLCSFEFLSPSAKNDLLAILIDKNTNKVEKKKSIAKLLTSLNKEFDSTYIELFKILITGGKMDLSKIYGADNTELNICFNSDFDQNYEEIQSLMGEDFDLVVCAKEIFDIVYIKSLIGDTKSKTPLSEAFVNKFNSHKNELKTLKSIVKKVDKIENKSGKNSNFYAIFKDENNACNYASLVGHNSFANKAKLEDFNKQIQKFLEEKKDLILRDEEDSLKISESDFNKILKKTADREYLESICHCSTSSIPHQLHEIELKLILQIVGRKYNFIASDADKIISIFRFKIPYYCGPLNLKSKYTCLVRNPNDKLTPIRPWNFDKTVNSSETRNKFLSSLTNKCSYLLGEDVLPKNSILYQDYVALDRLNGIRINNSLSNFEWKNIAYEILAKNGRTTIYQFKKNIEKYYQNKNVKNITISGLNDNDDFICSSRALFAPVFKTGKLIGSIPCFSNCKEDTSDFNLVEDIIKILEIFKDDRKEAIEFIKEKYSEYSFDEAQIRAMKQYKSSGWGRLSKTLLIGLPPIDENGVVNCDRYSSILQIMFDENLTLNQVLFKPVVGDVTYNEIIKYRNINGEEQNKAKNIINELPPMMRRSAIQSYRIVKEIIKLKGYEPQAIVIEVTRENDKSKKGKQTTSRYKEIVDFLKSLKADLGELKTQVSNLKTEVETLKEQDELALKGKHLYLYFKQLGMDMYTGEKINIDDIVGKNNKYDIDHIYPQSLIKDDSLDNMVLVSREQNQKVKKNLYPIPEEIRCNPKVVNLWQTLLKKKCISDEKYNRLIRARALEEDELREFVNRQINVVNTSNIALKKIFESEFKSKLIFSKAAAPSYVRKEYNVPKLRDLNDTHHAVDAYLNIICGKCLTSYFERQRHVLPEKLMADSRYNYEKIIKNIIENNLPLKEKIVSLPSRHDFLLTYRLSYNDSAFYNQKLSKGKNTLIPAHNNSDALCKTERYGGYDNLSNSYFLIGTVINKKGVESKQLIPVSNLYDKRFKTFNELKAKLEKQYSTNGKTVLIKSDKSLYGGQKLLINGCYYLLTLFNANTTCLFPVTPIYLNPDDSVYMKNALAYLPRIENVLKDDSTLNKVVLNVGKTIDKNGEEHINSIEFSKERNMIIFNHLISLAKSSKYSNVSMINKLTLLGGESDDSSNTSSNEVPIFSNQNIAKQIDIIRFMILQFGNKHGTKSVYKGITGIYSKSFASFFDAPCKVIEESITGLIRKATDL